MMYTFVIECGPHTKQQANQLSYSWGTPCICIAYMYIGECNCTINFIYAMNFVHISDTSSPTHKLNICITNMLDVDELSPL